MKQYKTPQDLKLTRFKVNDEEQSKKVQQAMFTLGFRWSTGGKPGDPRKVMPFPTNGYILVDNHCRMWHCSNSSGFEIHGYGGSGGNTHEVSIVTLYSVAKAHKETKVAERKARRQRKGGWIEHSGTKRPINLNDEDVIDIKYRSGKVLIGKKANESGYTCTAFWRTTDGMTHDIVAYRMHKVADKIEIASFEEMVKDIVGDAVGVPINQVGDVNSDARGSGARYNAGKPDFSLIPFETLEGEAQVWAYGAKKYSRNNWKKGMAWSVPFASMMRHMTAWQRGEEVDAETGQSHLDHAMCNLRMLKYYATNYQEGDDRK